MPTSIQAIAGLVMPPVRIRDNVKLEATEYAIKLRGCELTRGEVYPDQYLAMDGGLATEPIGGLKTVEPAFGLDAYWIDEGQRHGDRRTDEIEGHEKNPSGNEIRHTACQKPDHDIGHHLDGQGRSQHRPGILARKVIGKKSQRDGHEARAHESHDLSREKTTVRDVCQDTKHGVARLSMDSECITRCASL